MSAASAVNPVRAARRVHHALPTRLRWILLAVSLAGVALIYGSQLPWLHDTVLGEVVRDIGIAFLISALVAVIVELSLSRETYLRGLDAIMRRTVPDCVWEEFRQRVITQPLMRKSWSIRMKIRRQEDGRCVSETRVAYTIVALHDGLDTQVQHELDVYRTVPGERGRFARVICEGIEQADCEKGRTDGGMALALPIRLERHDDTKEIALEFNEVVRCPDAIAWWMSLATESVAVFVDELPRDLAMVVKTFHPSQRTHNELEVGKGWRFEGTMLPGQGFEIRVMSRHQ